MLMLVSGILDLDLKPMDSVLKVMDFILKPLASVRIYD